MRSCPRCGFEKSDTEFSKDCHSPTGLTYHCKECRRKNRPTKERQREYALRHYYKNKEEGALRNKDWRNSNKDRLSEYRKSRRVMSSMHSAKRRAKEVSATPSWASESAIKEVYEFAKEFRDAGFDVDVDHIEPLQGKSVCGLHVEHNLRVCLASMNRAKQNRQMEHFQ